MPEIARYAATPAKALTPWLVVFALALLLPDRAPAQIGGGITGLGGLGTLTPPPGPAPKAAPSAPRKKGAPHGGAGKAAGGALTPGPSPFLTGSAQPAKSAPAHAPGKSLPALDAPLPSGPGVVSAPPAAHTAGHGNVHPHRAGKEHGALPAAAGGHPGKSAHAPKSAKLPPGKGGVLPPHSLSAPAALHPHRVHHATLHRQDHSRPGHGKALRGPPPAATGAGAFRAHHAVVLALLGVLALLYVRHRREKKRTAQFERDAQNGGPAGHQPRAVVLPSVGFDPSVSFREDAAKAAAPPVAGLDQNAGLSPAASGPADQGGGVTGGPAATAATAAAPGAGVAAEPRDWGAIGAAAQMAAGVSLPPSGAAGANVPPEAAAAGTPPPAPGAASPLSGSPGAAAGSPPAAVPPVSGHGFVPSVDPLTPSKAAKQIIDGPPPSAFGAEPIKLADLDAASVKSRRHQGHPFPPPLGMHFDAQPGEVIKWCMPFRVPMASRGLVAITNQRLLSVSEARTFQAFPPNYAPQLKRHQCPLSSITRHETDSVPRPSFLVVAALLVFFFPFGTGLAAVAIAGYFLWRRPELTIWSDGVRLRYPLALVDQHDAQALLAHLVPENIKKNQVIDHRHQQAS